MSIKAREVPMSWMVLDDQAKWFGRPGDMARSVNEAGVTTGFWIACPKCGQFGCISFDAAAMPTPWRVTGGNIEDVTTLSVRDSILKHCCGWHGYLTDGEFKAC